MYRILVFGASGGTGRHFVDQALAAGHHVTVILRNPDAFGLRNQQLKIVKGDVLAPGSFDGEFAAHDAVISCLGIPKIQQTDLYSAGIANILKGMEASSLKRIMCISSGALDVPPGSTLIMRFLLKHVLQRVFKPIYADMRRMEELLKKSNMDWTIVRAPKLTDGKATGKYRDITGLPMRGIPKVSRSDLAAYMLAHLTDSGTYKRTIDVAY